MFAISDADIDALGALTGRMAAREWDKRDAALNAARDAVYAIVHPRQDVPLNTILATHPDHTAVTAYNAALARYYACEIDAGLRYGSEPNWRKRSLLENDKTRRIKRRA